MRLLRLPQQPGASTTTCPRAAECAGMVRSSDTAARHAAARARARAAGALDHDTQHRLFVDYSIQCSSDNGALRFCRYCCSLLGSAAGSAAGSVAGSAVGVSAAADLLMPAALHFCHAATLSFSFLSKLDHFCFVYLLAARHAASRAGRRRGRWEVRALERLGGVEDVLAECRQDFQLRAWPLGHDACLALRRARPPPLRCGPTTGSVGLRKLGRGSFRNLLLGKRASRARHFVTAFLRASATPWRFAMPASAFARATPSGPLTPRDEALETGGEGVYIEPSADPAADLAPPDTPADDDDDD